MPTMIDPKTGKKVIVAPLAKRPQQLPSGVTTGRGEYTAGTPIPSRSPPRAPNPVTRVDLPALQRLLQPATPSTGRYSQSRVANRGAQGAAPPAPIPLVAPSLIQDAQAKPMTTPLVTGRPARMPEPAMQGVVAGRSSQESLFQNLQGPAAGAALESTAPGTAVLSGKFAGEGTPSTRSYPQAGLAEAGKRLNVVPGLFSGVNAETEQALGAARQAAAERGDFEAVERSYLDTEERADYDAAKAERRLVKRSGKLPASQVPDALRGLTDLRTARQGKLEEAKVQRLEELRQNPESMTELDRILFGQRQPLAQRLMQIPVYGDPDQPGVRTGTSLVDQATGQPLAGGQAQGQQANPVPQPLPEGVTPELARSNAIAAARQNPAQFALVNQYLQMYGLPTLTQEEAAQQGT